MIKLFLFLNIAWFQFKASAQQYSITAGKKEVILKKTSDLVKAYADNLSLLASNTQPDQNRFFINDIVNQQFHAPNIYVYNDLNFKNSTEEDLTIDAYLERIRVLFPKGVDISIIILEMSDIYIDKADVSLFVKVKVERKLKGINNNKKAINDTKLLDVYVKFPMVVDQLRDPKIFAIDQPQDLKYNKVAIKQEAKNEIKTSIKTSNPKPYTAMHKPGGAENALVSLALPGLGNYFVNEKAHQSRFWITTATVTGFIGSAIFLKIKSDRAYDQYLNTADPFKKGELLGRAKTLKNTATFSAGLGGTIWMMDVVLVYVKGNKNKGIKSKTMLRSPR